MKLISIVGAIFALSGVALGLKDPICGQNPAGNGLCRAYGVTYGYDPDTNECKMLVFCGCGGNENRFEQKADCEAKCKE